MPSDLMPPPVCPAPLAEIRRPAFRAPALACDTHAHVISDDPALLVPERSYTPADAPLAAYLAMLDGLGMARGVLVQVSVHGTDNSLMLAALRAHPERLRGVAVVGPEVTEAELAEMHAAGVRGVRLNVLFGGGVPLDHLQKIAAKIAPFGWHVQLLINAGILPGMLPQIRALPVPVVIDHMGHLPHGSDITHPGFQALLELLRDGRDWVKLSGAYRVSGTTTPWHDTIPMARALAEVAPDRCVWGSDWPHVAQKPPMFNTTDTLDLLAQWLPDPELRARVLVANPARLYDFTA